MRAASQGSGRSRSRRSTSATSPFPRNHRPMNFPLLSFSRRVLSDFRANQGLLLAGAVAYNALLSLVPIVILLLVALAHVIDRQRLLDAVTININLLVPGQAGTITAQVEAFLANRKVIGVVGVGGLLFFSAM